MNFGYAIPIDRIMKIIGQGGRGGGYDGDRSGRGGGRRGGRRGGWGGPRHYIHMVWRTGVVKCTEPKRFRVRDETGTIHYCPYGALSEEACLPNRGRLYITKGDAVLIGIKGKKVVVVTGPNHQPFPPVPKRGEKKTPPKNPIVEEERHTFICLVCGFRTEDPSVLIPFPFTEYDQLCQIWSMKFALPVDVINQRNARFCVEHFADDNALSQLEPGSKILPKPESEVIVKVEPEEFSTGNVCIKSEPAFETKSTVEIVPKFEITETYKYQNRKAD